MTIYLALLIVIIYTTARSACGSTHMATNEQVIQAIADLQTRLAAARLRPSRRETRRRDSSSSLQLRLRRSAI